MTPELKNLIGDYWVIESVKTEIECGSLLTMIQIVVVMGIVMMTMSIMEYAIAIMLLSNHFNHYLNQKE